MKRKRKSGAEIVDDVLEEMGVQVEKPIDLPVPGEDFDPNTPDMIDGVTEKTTVELGDQSVIEPSGPDDPMTIIYGRRMPDNMGTFYPCVKATLATRSTDVLRLGKSSIKQTLYRPSVALHRRQGALPVVRESAIEFEQRQSAMEWVGDQMVKMFDLLIAECQFEELVRAMASKSAAINQAWPNGAKVILDPMPSAMLTEAVGALKDLLPRRSAALFLVRYASEPWASGKTREGNPILVKAQAKLAGDETKAWAMGRLGFAPDVVFTVCHGWWSNAAPMDRVAGLHEAMHSFIEEESPTKTGMRIKRRIAKSRAFDRETLERYGPEACDAVLLAKSIVNGIVNAGEDMTRYVQPDMFESRPQSTGERDAEEL